MAFRFVHAADIHLDSPLRSLALRNPDLARLIGDASRQAFTRIVDMPKNQHVEGHSLTTTWYASDSITVKDIFAYRKARTFSTSAIDGVAGGLDIHVHGLSFAQPHAPDSFLPRYKAPRDGAVNIGLMHTSLDGSRRHSLYAPCSVADLGASGFHYWALGHVHVRSAPPAKDRQATVVMPGIPQGRDIGEAGPKTVTLVTVRDDRTIVVETRPTSVAQFELVPVDLAGVENWAGVVDRVAAALGQARAEAVSSHLVARLTVTGATPFAWQIRRDPDRLLAEATRSADDLDATWIEKIELGVTTPPAASIKGDAIAELGDLTRKLPRDCRDAVLGIDAASNQDAMALLFAEGAEDVLARLREPPDAGPT